MSPAEILKKARVNMPTPTTASGEKISCLWSGCLGNAASWMTQSYQVWVYLSGATADVINDEVYQATCRTILSPENHIFTAGNTCHGLGSSHTFYRYIWPIALSIQGFWQQVIRQRKFLLDRWSPRCKGQVLLHESSTWWPNVLLIRECSLRE